MKRADFKAFRPCLPKPNPELEPKRVELSQWAWHVLFFGGLASRGVCEEIRRAYPLKLRGWDGKKMVHFCGSSLNERVQMLHDMNP